LPFLPSGPTEIVGTVPASRIQRAMQAASGSALSDVVARAVVRIVEAHLGQPLPLERVAAGSGSRAVERMLDSRARAGSLLLAGEALCVHTVLERPYLAGQLDRLQPVATCISVPYLLVRAPAAMDCSVGSAGHGGRSTALARGLAETMPSGSDRSPCREVTFNGGAAALQALLGGQVAMAVLPRALAGPWIDRGELEAVPLPTAVPGLPAMGWFGVFAPPGWPAARVGALGDALRAGFSDPLQQAWLERQGLAALPEPGAGLAARIRHERAALRGQKNRAGR
jgi:tripartite-type tricarboxylate transporter receptor subunit TctC